MKIGVFTNSEQLFQSIRNVIPKKIGDVSLFRKPVSTELDFCFVDLSWDQDIAKFATEMKVKRSFVVVIDDEKKCLNELPDLLVNGFVDDLLLIPIRPVEVLGKIAHAKTLLKLNDLNEINSGVSSLVEKLEDDLKIARGIQRTLIPEKFSQVPGLKVFHKYLAGFKSGGDYLDFFEFEDSTHVGMLMSDSTGYGLSSSFLSVMLKLAIQLSKSESKSPALTVQTIFEEVKKTMKPKESLSLFYGVLNRKTLDLTFTVGGSIRFLHQKANEHFIDRSLEVDPLTTSAKFNWQDHHVGLHPEDRLVLVSDGYWSQYPSTEDFFKAIKPMYGKEPLELINQLQFKVKSKLESDEDMPEQDCSVLVMDVDKRAMRLAK